MNKGFFFKMIVSLTWMILSSHPGKTQSAIDSLKNRMNTNSDWLPGIDLSSSQQSELAQMEKSFLEKISAGRSGSFKTSKEKSEAIRQIYQWRENEISRILKPEQFRSYKEKSEKRKTENMRRIDSLKKKA